LSRTREHQQAAHVTRASQDDGDGDDGGDAGGDAGGDGDYGEDDKQCPMWEVHAGTFSFTISALFALSTVTVYPESKRPIVYRAPKPDTGDIYSRPMYITDQQPAILSDLKVSMTFEGSGGSEGTYEPQWEVQAIITNAPRALWDACKRLAPAPPMIITPTTSTANPQRAQTTPRPTPPPDRPRCSMAPRPQPCPS
jgi:hypothetical protein